MGLTIGSANKIIKLTFKTKHLMLTLGKQSVAFYLNDLKKYILVNASDKIRGRFNYLIAKKKFIYLKKENKKHINDFFYHLLGFKKIVSLDVSGYQGANIIFDLNKNYIPNKIKNIADFILDASTLEHIFNTKNALQNLHKILKKNGLICHILPSNNMPKDGFYQFSPDLFINYNKLNGYKIQTKFFWVFDYQKKIFSKTVKSKSGKDYYFNNYDKALKFSNKFNYPLQIILVAKKIINKSKIKVPFQEYYHNKKKWKKYLYKT